MPQANTEPTTNEQETTAKPQGQANPQGKGQKKKASAAKKDKADKPAKAEKPPKPPREKKERPVRDKPAHLAKVERVAQQLPQMSPEAQALYVAANNLSTADISGLVAHLNIVMRKRHVVTIAQGAARNDGEPLLRVGARVRIRSGQGGSARFIGQEGTVTKVQRIRCYVAIDGRQYNPKRKADGITDYFFISDVQPLEASGGVSLQEALTRLTQPAPMVDISTLEDEDSGAPAAANG